MKTQGLPSTPYYKMIDYWLLFTMNIMVYTLAFHTFLQVPKNLHLEICNIQCDFLQQKHVFYQNVIVVRKK